MNGYSGITIEKLNWKIKQNLNNENEAKGKQQIRRVAVTYTFPYIRILMNTFKDTNTQIAYKPANKIGNYLNNHSKQNALKTAEYMN